MSGTPTYGGCNFAGSSYVLVFEQQIFSPRGLRLVKVCLVSLTLAAVNWHGPDTYGQHPAVLQLVGGLSQYRYRVSLVQDFAHPQGVRHPPTV